MLQQAPEQLQGAPAANQTNPDLSTDAGAAQPLQDTALDQD
jgi:hypothetical protein